MKSTLTLLSISLLMSACAISPRQIPARIYKPSGEVLTGEFIWNGGLTGKVTVVKSTETCIGEYSTAASGTVTTSIGITSVGTGPNWGKIFALGAGTSTSSTTDKAQRGVAIAVCPSGEMIECEYVAGINPSYQGRGDPNLLVGHGSCKSNKSQDSFRLMFSGGGAM